jgi:hypothetical protein
MRLSSVISDSLELTLRNRALWVFGFFVAAGGGASGSADTSGSSQDVAAGASAGTDATQELPGALAGLATTAASLGELVAANLPLVMGGAAALGLGVLALHVLSEGALIEGVTRLHRDPAERFTLRRGFRLGLDHFGAVLGIKVLAMLLGLLLASVAAAPFVLAGLGVLPVAAAVAIGLPLAVLAIPAGITLYLVYALGLRVAVLENRRVVDAMHRARRLLHGRLLDGLKLLLTVGLGRIASQLLVIPVVLPVLALAGLGWLVGGLVGAVVAVVTVAVPLALLLAALLGTWQSSVWSLGYLATVEEGARA